MNKGLARMESQTRTKMCDGGWSENEIEDYMDYVNADGCDGHFPFSRLVRECSIPGRFEFQHTLAIAKSMDELNVMFWDIRRADNVPRFKKMFINEGILTVLKEWLSAAGEEKYLAQIQAALESGNTWDDCRPIVSATEILFLYQLLACWDIEFLSIYLTNRDGGRGMTPQPIMELFMPVLKPGAKPLPDGRFPAHGLFHLPLRRLLDFCYCLSVLQREGRWPSKRRITRTQVAGAGGPILQGDASDQPLAKIRKGLRGLSLDEFREVWTSMVDQGGHTEVPMPPWPWYVGSQILTLMFIEGSEHVGAKSMLVPTPSLYRYWWERYFSELKAKGLHFGDTPWPSHLQAS